MKRALVASLLAVLPLLVHAGVWGEGSFENDDALDWVGQCIKAGTTAPVSAALAAVLDGRYVQAPDGSEAVAAAEVIAAAMGKPGADMPPELRAWMRRQPADELRGLAPMARRALSRVLDPKVSELSQLWAEARSTQWTEAIADLERRLGP